MARPGETQHTGPPTRAVLQAQGHKSQVLPQRTLTCPAASGTGARRGAIGALTLHLALRAAAWLQAAPRDVAPWDTPARGCGGTPGRHSPPSKQAGSSGSARAFSVILARGAQKFYFHHQLYVLWAFRAFSFVSEFQDRVRSLFTAG